MNFLNTCLSRYRRVTFRTTPYCRNAVKSLINRGDIWTKRIPCNIRHAERLPIKLNTENLRVTFVPMMWTQVRFCKDCPRLHRDIQYPNFDTYRKKNFTDVRKTNWGDGDEKQGTTYVVGLFGILCGAYGVKAIMIHYISYMSAAADVVALASIEVDISKVAPGSCLSIKWRGKPLFVKNRTSADIDFESNTPLSALRDPETEAQRTVKKEWLVVIGICTHLGCVPIPNSGDWSGGFYCPCHGSHYDNLGRARKGPAPTNLEIPPYKFASDTLVLVG